MSRLLLAIVTVAALAVLPSREGSALVTLYREPKAVVLSALVWLWLAALPLAAVGRASLAVVPRVVTARAVAPWLLWVAYMTLTALWGTVADNAIYELRTLLPATLWMVALVAWQRVDPRAADGIRRALIVALAAVSAIGALQLARPIGWLPPIHPELGGPHASTFGFKNPAALAVLGQWFLVLGWVLSEKRPAWKILAAALCLGEAVYVASLHSRTALLALVVGLLFLGFATSWRRAPASGGVASRTLAVAAFGGLAALIVVVALVTPWRERALLGAEMLIDPAAYLESDRGTYLLNTLAMVERHPVGVGLGDWQTLYPVFRRHHRDFAFDRQVEVRRAHSDHVQIFGEGGWPGLALWLGAIATTILGGIRRWRAAGDLRALSISAQLVAWATAMATDYVVEMPFHRYQFLLVVALALSAGSATVDRSRARPPGRAFAVALACALAFVAATEAWRGALVLDRLRASAWMVQTYQRALATGDPTALERALDFGETVARRPGYTKSTPRDERVLAHLYWLHGAETRARFWLRRSLDHQPYAPAGLELASRVLARRWPDAAADFARAHDHVVSEARSGFEGPYPTWPAEASSR